MSMTATTPIAVVDEVDDARACLIDASCSVAVDPRHIEAIGAYWQDALDGLEGPFAVGHYGEGWTYAVHCGGVDLFRIVRRDGGVDVERRALPPPRGSGYSETIHVSVDMHGHVASRTTASMELAISPDENIEISFWEDPKAADREAEHGRMQQMLAMLRQWARTPAG